MKTFAVDFAFYDFGYLVFTMKWIHAKTEENAIDQLLKEHRNIHIQDIREIRDYIK